MDHTAPTDVIKTARERAQQGLPRRQYDYDDIYEDYHGQNEQPQRPPPVGPVPARPRQAASPQNGQSRIPRQQQAQGQRRQAPPIAPRPGMVTNNAGWPLNGPLASPVYEQSQPQYRAPPRQAPPPRPQRPSQVPSLAGSQAGQPIPVGYRARQPPAPVRQVSNNSGTPPTTSSGSRGSAASSNNASISDFPLPIQNGDAPMMPAPLAPAPIAARRSANLGPPPSARRGLSSFYSHNSYVSPIPEESPRSKTQSHGSYASSSAVPESWSRESPAVSPQFAQPYSESILDVDGETPGFEEDGEESQLVRSASMGKRARAVLVEGQPKDAKATESSPAAETVRPSLTPAQPKSPFMEGTALFLDGSTSSLNSTQPSLKKPTANDSGLTAEAILSAYDAAAARNPSGGSSTKRLSVSPGTRASRGFSRLSAIRRPPRLDIESVREAESRGSMTSLPDLIRRATQLAASLDRGKRPASRANELDFAEFFNGKKSANQSTPDLNELEKHRSGFSDMLAAFPNPSRDNLRQESRNGATSWPPAPRRSRHPNDPYYDPDPAGRNKKQGRRCCGMPLWLAIVLGVALLVVVAAAIVLPLEFFVFRKQNKAASESTAQAAIAQCQSQVTCQNGGSNVVTSGFCSCICTNGFTGFDCSISDSTGCTTANIQGATNINNVTLGDALPRLIVQANSNFSIPLSGTQILSKFNAGNLSCAAENALVTFDGQKGRKGAGNAAVTPVANVNDLVASTTLVVVAGQHTSTTIPYAGVNNAASATSADFDTATFPSPTFTVSIIPTTTETVVITITPSVWPSSMPSSYTSSLTVPPSMSIYSSSNPTPTTAPSTSNPTASFTVTEDVLDFARVAVLFILQQKTLGDAEFAQAALQKSFSTGLSNSAAGNVTIGDGNSVDLVGMRLDVGDGVVGGKVGTKRRRGREEGIDEGLPLLWE